MKKRNIITICICLFILLAAIFLLGPSFIDPNHALPPPPPPSKVPSQHFTPPHAPPPRTVSPPHAPIQPPPPQAAAPAPIQQKHYSQDAVHPQGHVEKVLPKSTYTHTLPPQQVRQPTTPSQQSHYSKDAIHPQGHTESTPSPKTIPHHLGQNQRDESYRRGTPITPQITQQQKQYAKDATHAQGRIKERNQQYHQWFSDDFYSRHNHHPHFHDRGNDWWSDPSWNGVSDWMSNGSWDEPLYYGDDGTAYAVPPADTIVGGEPMEQNVQSTPQQSYLPLGVFAAGRSANDAAYSSMFIQLALGKDGQIVGTYYNSQTDEVFDLAGSVDQYTQEATWKLADNATSPTMTTGLYNLTQDAAIVQVRFPNGTNQTWTLVRLNN